MAEKGKVSNNLTPIEVATLKELAQKRETTVTETLRRAIAMEKFIDQATSSGKSLLLKDNEDRRSSASSCARLLILRG